MKKNERNHCAHCAKGASNEKGEIKFLLIRFIPAIKQNLFLSFIYNILAIPIAAGVFYPVFGVTLNPAIAAIAMSASSVSVVMNSLMLKRRGGL